LLFDNLPPSRLWESQRFGRFPVNSNPRASGCYTVYRAANNGRYSRLEGQHSGPRSTDSKTQLRPSARAARCHLSRKSSISCIEPCGIPLTRIKFLGYSQGTHFIEVFRIYITNSLPMLPHHHNIQRCSLHVGLKSMLRRVWGINPTTSRPTVFQPNPLNNQSCNLTLYEIAQRKHRWWNSMRKCGQWFPSPCFNGHAQESRSIRREDG